MKFSPGQASSYPSKQTNEKVTIAVKAYDTEDLAHTAFGKVNPYQYNILPVLVIVQNDTDETLRLDRLKVEYESYDGKLIDSTPAADVPYAVESPNRPSNPVPTPIPIHKKHKNPLAGVKWRPAHLRPGCCHPTSPPTASFIFRPITAPAMRSYYQRVSGRPAAARNFSTSRSR